MTRKDYQKIAAAIAATRTIYNGIVQPGCTATLEEALDTVSLRLADLLAADNPNFDRARFYAATKGN